MAFFQFNIVLGIVIAYLTNYWIVGIPHDWQWMLGIEPSRHWPSACC